MSDWYVWPLFVLQFIILGLLFVPKNTFFLGIRIKVIIMTLLFVVCIGIGVSLYHDSSSVLQLYF